MWRFASRSSASFVVLALSWCFDVTRGLSGGHAAVFSSRTVAFMTFNVEKQTVATKKKKDSHRPARANSMKEFQQFFVSKVIHKVHVTDVYCHFFPRSYHMTRLDVRANQNEPSGEIKCGFFDIMCVVDITDSCLNRRLVT